MHQVTRRLELTAVCGATAPKWCSHHKCLLEGPAGGVLATVERGTPKAKVVRTFGGSLPTLKCWLKRRRETGEVSPRTSPGRPTIGKIVVERRTPREQLKNNRVATLERHRELWKRASSARGSASLRRARRSVNSAGPRSKVVGSRREGDAGDRRTPSVSPIKEAFSKVKASLRRALARTREASVEATG